MTFVCGFMIKSWYTHPLKCSWHAQTIVNVFLNRKREVELVKEDQWRVSGLQEKWSKYIVYNSQRIYRNIISIMQMMVEGISEWWCSELVLLSKDQVSAKL